MNLNILICILFTSGLFIILRSFSKWGIDNFQGIVFNYFVAGSCALLHDFNNNVLYFPECRPFIPVSLGIGLMFILVFMLTAKVTQVAGVGVASVASKLSMVIPITAGVMLYHDGMGFQKIAGLVLALAAVFLINLTQKGEDKKAGNSWFLPVVLFIGCGIVDTSIKFSQHFYMTDHTRHLMIMCMFFSAGILGFMKLVYEVLFRKMKINLKNAGGGLILGTCNYLSIFFLIRSFEFPGAESSKVFAMVNLGVVLFCTAWAVVIYREQLNKFKITGLLIAVSAIIILYFV